MGGGHMMFLSKVLPLNWGWAEIFKGGGGGPCVPFSGSYFLSIEAII